MIQLHNNHRNCGIFCIFFYEMYAALHINSVFEALWAGVQAKWLPHLRCSSISATSIKWHPCFDRSTTVKLQLVQPFEHLRTIFQGPATIEPVLGGFNPLEKMKSFRTVIPLKRFCPNSWLSYNMLKDCMWPRIQSTLTLVMWDIVRQCPHLNEMGN